MKWISVNERLPDPDDKAIFWTYYTTVKISYFRNGTFVNLLGLEVKATHWIKMPLPEPPTE